MKNSKIPAQIFIVVAFGVFFSCERPCQNSDVGVPDSKEEGLNKNNGIVKMVNKTEKTSEEVQQILLKSDLLSSYDASIKQIIKALELEPNNANVLRKLSTVALYELSWSYREMAKNTHDEESARYYNTLADEYTTIAKKLGSM